MTLRFTLLWYFMLNVLGVCRAARAWRSGATSQSDRAFVTSNELSTPRSPSAEQGAIAAFLDSETRAIDALVAKVRDAIDRLKELRTALISAAVTGKIDVREEAA